MAKLDELIARAHPTASAPSDVPVLALARGDNAEATIAWLVDYFGADDTRQVVGLVVDGKEVGYLEAVDLYHLVEVSTRALGVADAAILPGTPRSLRFLELRCPVVGCAEGRWVMLFDEENAPPCRQHATAKLRPAP